MKRCICKAISANLDELHALAKDLEGLGEHPHIVGHELTVQFNELLLMPTILEMFDQFEQHSVYAEF